MVVKALPYFDGPRPMNQPLGLVSQQPMRPCLIGDYPDYIEGAGIFAHAKSNAKSHVSSRIFRLAPKLFYHKLKNTYI